VQDVPAHTPIWHPTESALGILVQSCPSPVDVQPPHDSSSLATSMHSYAHSPPKAVLTELPRQPRPKMRCKMTHQAWRVPGQYSLSVSD
jgi:hypothetical protein